MECKEEPLKAATGGATITIQTLSKSASARALHTDRHQWTHNICAAGIIQSLIMISYRTVQPL